ncbi:hypothetical protein [Roseivivax sediminis]|uniref:Uncharacterized protein n=1 Tax=Roseivivax sediminis TaxID=936889 RepID=A0A1I1W7F0_9RHOB|nr:hypothetical protein [Roseivivax sediminis]SFD90358.1 hypothetical protein SAMN04515678_104143 [Roseivivax sediminis]
MHPYFAACAALTTLSIEAQTVFWTRVAGLSGYATLPQGEAQRMAAEKPRAFAESGAALTRAIWRGAPAAALFGIWAAPLTRTARANRRRLGRHRTRRARATH